jgi:predicted DNA-binding transcriptional regulator AlpA
MRKSAPAPVAPRYLTLQAAAVYLSLSPKTLYRMVDARSIPFSQISVSPRTPEAPKRFHYRFDRVALDAFMSGNSVTPPAHLA